jgi:hypothetical protein
MTTEQPASDPKLLAQLFEFGQPEEPRLWREDELAAVLDHQLRSPVQFDLSNIAPELRGKLRSLSESQGLLIRSFADILEHPHPPIELLQMTKQFAKSSAAHPGSPLPREITMLLYFAAIAAALVKCNQRITQLEDQPLREGWQWLIAQPWVNEKLRALLTEAAGRLG